MYFPTLLLLLGALAQNGLAAPCDGDCHQMVHNTLKDSLNVAEQIAANAVNEMVVESSKIIDSLSYDISDINVSGLSKEKVAQVLKQLMQTLEQLKKITGIGLFPNSLIQKILEKISKSLDKATNDETAQYGVAIDTLKEKLREALKGFGPIVRTVVIKAIDLVQGRIDKLLDKVGSLMRLVGLGDKWAAVELIIKGVLEKIKNTAGYSAETSSAYSAEIVADDIEGVVKYDVAMKMFMEMDDSAAYGVQYIDTTALKAALEVALAGVKPLVKTIVIKAVDFVGDRIDNLIGRVGKVLRFLGLGAEYDKVKAIIDQVVADLKNKVIPQSDLDNLEFAIAQLELEDAEYGFPSIDISKLKAALKDALKDFKPIVQEAVLKVVDLVGGRIDKLVSKAGQIATILGLGGQWAQIEAKINEVLQKIKDKVIDVSSDEMSDEAYGLSINIDVLRKYLNEALKDFKPIVRTLVNKALDLVGDRLDLLMDKAEKIFNILGMSGTWQKVKVVIDKVRAEIRDKLNVTVADEMTSEHVELAIALDAMDDIAYGMIDIAKLKAALKDALKDFKPIVQEAVLKVVDLVGGRIDKLVSKAGQIATILGLGGQWDKIEAKINEVLQKIKDKVIDVSSDELYADGADKIGMLVKLA